jgi:peptidyl-Lys metalloendopeptidase
LTNSLFEITRDGKPVEYHGRMVKRQVTTSDYIRMKPGKYSATISLAQAYDVKPPGHYTVRYSVFNQMTVPIDSNELVIERK